MNVLSYFTQRAGEFVLLVVSAGCFACVAHLAFFLESVAGFVPLTFVVVALLVAVLYAVAYRRQNLAVGIVAYVALVAALVAVALALSTGESIYEDAEGNYLYWALVCALAATAAFLLSRTRPGAVLWFLVVAFTCSIIQGFYENDAVALSLIASAAALALIVYRNFSRGLYAADAAATSAKRGHFVASLLPVAAAAALALGLWFLVIAPLNPPVAKLALITDYKQLPIVELRGVVDEEPVLDLSMTSDQLTDGYTYTTDDLVEGPSDVVLNAQQVLDQITTGGGTTDAGQGNLSGTESGLDEDSLEEEFDTQSYSVVFPLIITIAVVALVVAAFVVGSYLILRWWRMKRLRDMLSAPTASEQVQSLYAFLLSRLAKVGVVVPSGTTLSEFSSNTSVRLASFDEQAKVPFSQLTETFEACAYGNAQPAREDVVPFAAYYLGFFKAARQQLGAWKYFWKSFRL